MRKGSNVRLTDQAHGLLAEKAEYYNVSMKDFASEAVQALAKGKDRNKELRVLLDTANQRIQDDKWRAIGTFILGAIAAGCLMFAVGVAL